MRIHTFTMHTIIGLYDVASVISMFIDTDKGDTIPHAVYTAIGTTVSVRVECANPCSV